MSIPAFVSGFKTFGTHTETAGTAIDEEIPGSDNVTLALIESLITTGATAHLGSLMYAQGTGTRITCPLGAASGQKDIVCSEAPKDPAGNAAAASDIIAFQVNDGTWEFDTVASLSSLTITCTNNLTGVIAATGKVRVFGIIADGANFGLTLGASADNELGKGEIAFVHPYMGDPFYLSIDNGTNASTIRNLVFAYINKSGGG